MWWEFGVKEWLESSWDSRSSCCIKLHLKYQCLAFLTSSVCHLIAARILTVYYKYSKWPWVKIFKDQHRIVNSLWQAWGPGCIHRRPVLPVCFLLVCLSWTCEASNLSFHMLPSMFKIICQNQEFYISPSWPKVFHYVFSQLLNR